MSLLAALLPSVIGGIASLFKGKKTQYTPQQTPQQQAAYNQLLRMLQQRMGQPSAGMGAGNDALNILTSTFLNKGYTPQGQGQMPNQSYGQGGFPLMPNILRQKNPAQR